jgi:hypothetical protein
VADQLVTLAQVKARLSITDTTDDTLLGELIDQASDYIQDIAARKLVPDDAATYVIDTVAGSVIEVRRGIRLVTSLGIAASDQPDTGGTYTAVDLADVLLRPAAMARRPGWPATRILLSGSAGRLTTALNGARIVGNFGFASVPPRVQAVALDAVATAYTSRQAGDSDAVGPEASPVAVWARMFAEGTDQRALLDGFRSGAGIH